MTNERDTITVAGSRPADPAGAPIMNHLHFPTMPHHSHLPVLDVNEVFDEKRTVGQRAADKVAVIIGSWPFIIIQSTLLIIWVILNVGALIRHWDPYPFILMNLLLSLQAAFTAPIIMMSQNRQAVKDRLDAHNDFLVNQKAEEEIRTILEHLDAQNNALNHLYALLLEIQQTQAPLVGPTEVESSESPASNSTGADSEFTQND
ncbi:MAG: DUF1003 domain-containing protein [Caldilineaceae bacterium]|nr:DUF1003 domain-containing protein [Caldilineaceae bacterium]